MQNFRQTIVTLGLLIGLCCFGRADELKTQKDWPLFRGDSNSTGVSRSTLPAKPDLLWKFEVKGGAFESTAAIVNDVAYIGDMDGKLFAFEVATGKLLWEHKVEAGFMASPAVRDGKLFIGDMDGRIYCFDTQTGKPLWGYDTQGEIDSSANFYKDNVLIGSQNNTL